MCDDTRQEFILLSDVLGVSSLVETLNGPPEGTESTVLGPFHMTSSPARELGATIDDVGGGRRALVTGRVVDPAGRPLPGAEIDVWQCTEDGFYDVQQPDVQPPGNGRGLFHADDEGSSGSAPSSRATTRSRPTGRSARCWARPRGTPTGPRTCTSRLAPGFETLTTHLFVAGSPYLD